MRWLMAGVLLAVSCGATASVPPPTPAPTVAPADTLPPPPAATGLVSRPSPVPATPAVIGPPLDPLLMDVITGKKIPVYKATYVLKEGADILGGTTTQTYVFRTPEYRFDYAVAVLGIPQTVIAIASKTAFYVCLELLGRKTCYEAPLAELERASERLYRPLDELASRLGELEISRSGDVQVAGRSGHCFDFKPKPGTATFDPMNVCYTAEGIPLRTTETTPRGAIVMEATAVSTSVADAEFIPPYAVTKLPTAAPTSR